MKVAAQTYVAIAVSRIQMGRIGTRLCSLEMRKSVARRSFTDGLTGVIGIGILYGTLYLSKQIVINLPRDLGEVDMT